jgi:hypothetical protein
VKSARFWREALMTFSLEEEHPGYHQHLPWTVNSLQLEQEAPFASLYLKQSGNRIWIMMAS